VNERVPMIEAAWQAATVVVDQQGGLVGDLATSEARLLSRKACRETDADDCRAVFRSAVQVAQASARFRRSRCGHSQPGAKQRYELLLTLATELESSYPQCDQLLILLACRRLEMEWDR